MNAERPGKAQKLVRERPVATPPGAAPPLLLDTHVWLWWLAGHQSLSRGAQAALLEAQRDHRLHVSEFSLWELALKAGRGSLRLRLPLRDWMTRAREAPGIHYRPIAADDLLSAHELPDTPFRDPIDRALVAMARSSGMTLVTADREIIRWCRHRALDVLVAGQFFT